MKQPVQLATMTIDLSEVLEIRDDQRDDITLVIGPVDAVNLLVLSGADAEAIRKWLAEDHQRYLEYEASKVQGTPNGFPKKGSPPTLTEPPF